MTVSRRVAQMSTLIYEENLRNFAVKSVTICENLYK